MSYVHTLEAVISQVKIPFRPKHDPSRNLAEEIESCKRKIWECIDPSERQQYFEKKHKKSEKKDVENESDKENSELPSKNTKLNLEEPTKVTQKAQKNKNNPPLTRTDIELKVFIMKVVELKKELKARGKDTSGLKKDLRTRLVNTMLEEIKIEEEQALMAQSKSYCASSSESREESQGEQKKSQESKEVSKDSKEKSNELDEKISIENTKISVESQRKESFSSMQVETNSDPAEKAKETHENDSTKLVSTEKKQELGQNKPMNIVKEHPKKNESSLSAIREMEVELSSNGPNQLESQEGKSDLTEGKLKQFSENKKGNDSNESPSGPPSEISCSSKMSGNSVKDMVSKFSGFSSSLSSNNSGSALSKGMQARKEARQAKIAEMRAKAQSKPVTATKVALTSKEYSSTLSSLNATASTASTKKKNLATQMREKAAARAFQNKISTSVSKTGSTTMSTSSNKRHLPFKNNSNYSNNTVPDSLGATLKQPALIKKPSKVLSPMDTYEISDREDSETDDSDSEAENDKPRKKIPTWAQRPNLLAALQEQYNGRIGSVKVDPDDIFPEVQSCDLEAIFGPKKSKLYKRRASSGNWANDQVTAAEKLVYKREMGFTTNKTEV